MLPLKGRLCLFTFDFSYLNAVDLDTVSALSWWDAVLYLHARQEVPPEGSTTRLQHLHVHAIGSKAHLEDNNKPHTIKQTGWQLMFIVLSINHLQLLLVQIRKDE